MNKLPRAFLEQMESILREEYKAFVDSYNEVYFQGLRVNRLKIDKDTFIQRYATHLNIRANEDVPWCPTGFYYRDASEKAAVSKSPLYHAGLYYIQEPSAMAPVELLDVQQGMRVLDLCAAPGGKSVQIAAKLAGEGLLVSNDISLKRTKAILRNIEIQGIKNALITNGTPQELSEFFGAYFDRILVDAPCSGEGMFRKDPSIINAYEEVLQNVEAVQYEILTEAAKMLAPDGLLAYSTCTFNPKENEHIILKFLAAHSGFEMVDMHTKYPQASAYGFQTGLNGVAGFRLYPHHLKGEGHFICLLRKKMPDKDSEFDKMNPELLYPIQALKNIVNHDGKDNAKDITSDYKRSKNNLKKDFRNKAKNELEIFSKYEKHSRNKVFSRGVAENTDYIALLKKYEAEQLNTQLQIGNLIYQNDAIYNEILNTRGAKFRIIRNGLYMGDVKNNEFTPSSAFILSMKEQDFKNTVSFTIEDVKLTKYLKGETIEIERPDGIYYICVDEFPLGFAKIKNHTAKNYYNKNWRLL